MKMIVARIEVRPVIRKIGVEKMFGVTIRSVTPEAFRMHEPLRFGIQDMLRVTAVFEVHRDERNALVEFLRPQRGRWAACPHL